MTVTIGPDETGGHRLTTSLRLPCPRNEVFRFFADAGNLERITPPSLRFRILTPLPIDMETGALIDYRIRIRGIPVRWQTEITAWDPPHRFVDEQRRGPYRCWIHEHRFVDEGDSTLCEDEVRYAVPGGGLSHALLVRPEVERIFRYRAEMLTELFG